MDCKHRRDRSVPQQGRQCLQEWSRKAIFKILLAMLALSCSLPRRYAMRGWSSSGRSSYCRSSPDCAPVGILLAILEALCETARPVVPGPHEELHDGGPGRNPANQPHGALQRVRKSTSVSTYAPGWARSESTIRVLSWPAGRINSSFGSARRLLGGPSTSMLCLLIGTPERLAALSGCFTTAQTTRTSLRYGAGAARVLGVQLGVQHSKGLPG